MSSNNIVLTSAVRSNLVALQNTSEMQAKVQERLATGKKVNSALDNPSNFFAAASGRLFFCPQPERSEPINHAAREFGPFTPR